MNRFQAAERVNEAFRAAKANEALKDPKSTGFTVDIDGQTASCEFKHSTHAMEQRKDDMAKFRLALVEELVSKPNVLEPVAEVVEDAPPAEPEPKA